MRQKLTMFGNAAQIRGKRPGDDAVKKRRVNKLNIPFLPARLSELIRNSRFPVHILKGSECNSRCELTLVVVGSSIDVEYLVRLAFDGHCERINAGKVWSWGIHRLIRKMRSSADLFFMTNVESKTARALQKHDGGIFFIPRFVSGEVEFSTARVKMQNKGLKSDLRRIEKYNLKYEVTKDRALFDEFYHTMYVPHITKTFAETAALVDRQRFHENSKDCELLLVTRDGERIAGSVIVHENGRARGWATGVKDGSETYKRQGALSALYYFEIVHLEKLGLSREHYGGSRPFLKDGAIQYKKKWGMHLTGKIREGFLLKTLRDSEGARAFLRNNPFVYAGSADHRYYGAIFADESDRQSDTFIQFSYKHYFFPGMENIVIHYFDQVADRGRIPSDLAPVISLTNTQGLLG